MATQFKQLSIALEETETVRLQKEVRASDLARRGNAVARLDAASPLALSALLFPSKCLLWRQSSGRQQHQPRRQHQRSVADLGAMQQMARPATKVDAEDKSLAQERNTETATQK